MTPKPALKLVPTEPPGPSVEGLYDYEHEERRRIASRDWAAVHVRGDRAPPLQLLSRLMRGWR